MNIMKLLSEKAKDNWNARPVTIAFLGDSVTQGCFEIYEKSKGEIETVFDKNHAYHNYVAKILSVLFPSVPVNIINAGMSGDNAPHALERIEEDVLRYHPDLTVVCFGLNDCNEGIACVDKYVDALRDIFGKLKETGSEIIFMTPNMMNTGISCHITDSLVKEIAEDSMNKTTACLNVIWKMPGRFAGNAGLRFATAMKNGRFYIKTVWILRSF